MSRTAGFRRGASILLVAGSFAAFGSSTLLADCGVPGSGDCGRPHGGLGCEQTLCCKLTCTADPFCCDVGWDDYCAREAVASCEGVQAPVLDVMSFAANVTLPGGLAVEASDLVAYDRAVGQWSTLLDGDDVELGGLVIAAAAALPDGDILVVLDAGGFIPGLVGGPLGGLVEPYDVIRFTPDQFGSMTLGTWSFYFDGSDVGLSGNSNRQIASIAVLSNGHLVLGFKGASTVPGSGSYGATDLLRFTPTSLGADTAGTWQKYFEGADVALTQTSERLDSCFVGADGVITLSTQGNFSVSGLTGVRSDLFRFVPTSLGTVTTGTFSADLRASVLALPSTADSQAYFRMSYPFPTGPRPGSGGGSGGGGLNPPTSCGDPNAGACCEVSEFPYCEDSSCCEIVCAIDPVCCAVQWDYYCASAAAQVCTPCMPAPRAVMNFRATTTLPGGLVVNACDLAAFDIGTGAWSLLFDGDDVGLAGKIINAAALTPSGDILVAVEAGGTLAGLVGGPAGTAFEGRDLLRFAPTSLGDSTAGTWNFHFDGSDVGLSSAAAGFIRALSPLDGTSFVIATAGDSSLTGVGSFKTHDLVRFTPTSLGATTAGTWTMYFDGSDVALASSSEPLDAAFVRPNGQIMLSTRGAMSVSNFSAGGADLVDFVPTSLGTNTAGTFTSAIYAAQMGLPSTATSQSAFMFVPVAPANPRPVSDQILFDAMPSTEHSLAAVDAGYHQIIIIYGGVDPDATTTGVINADLVVEAVLQQYGPDPKGWGVLDFEVPFFTRLEAGSSSPTWQQTVDTCVALLQRMKTEFPQVKWTMYGMPLLRYWISGTPTYSWADAPEALKEQQLTKVLEAFRPVLDACDWLNPSSYDRYELAAFTPDRWAQITAQETQWRRHQMILCNRYNATSGLPAKPIIPMVSPMVWKSGTMEYTMKQLPAEEILRDQVRPLIAEGASGVGLWTGFGYYTRAACSAQDLGASQQEARYAFTRDFLGGVTPTNWTDPAVFAELVLDTSLLTRQRLDEIRADLQSQPSGGN